MPEGNFECRNGGVHRVSPVDQPVAGQEAVSAALAQARRYWHYEYTLAVYHLVPLLRRWGVSLKGSSIIDIGCAYGGGACGLYDSGARCDAFDVDTHFIDMARQLKGERAIPFAVGDLYGDEAPFMDRRYDLIVLHDVFEHLEQKDEILGKLKTRMKTGGCIFITFPPYYSAYGAHQQILRFPLARLPFFHLIPLSLSALLPHLKSEHEEFVREIQKLGRLKMGIRKFEAIVRRNGLHVRWRQAYIIGPNHIRFGLKPVPAGFVVRFPVLNELLCSGIAYLLSTD
jgi:SAM-dependent methyltransferase